MTSKQIFKQWQASTKNLRRLHVLINANRNKYHALWNEFDDLKETNSIDSESIERIQRNMDELQTQYGELSELHKTLMEKHDDFYQQHQAAVAQELARITGSN